MNPEIKQVGPRGIGIGECLQSCLCWLATTMLATTKYTFELDNCLINADVLAQLPMCLEIGLEAFNNPVEITV